MNKGLKIFIGVLIVLIAVCGIVFCMNKKGNEEEALKDTVIITDGKIENENLIDEFINDTSKDTERVLKIVERHDGNETNIQITFIPKEEKISQEDDENMIVNMTAQIPETEEDYQKEYGSYIFSINGEEKSRHNALRWQIKRATKDDKVKLYFYSIADVTEFPTICEYDLEGSNYKQKFKITYNQRKDQGIKTITDKNTGDYSLCTFGGDVTITIDGDMVYSLEDAVSQNVISKEDILEQAKMDERYGLCEMGYYLDGGSTEYVYSDYTILKCNTLDGNKDLYIGMSGQILSQINKIIE